MLTERIKARARDANPLGIAHSAGRRLTFHKIATRKDGSRTGKCDICIDTDPKAIVYGVLFEIPESQFDDLDTFEQGYSLVELVVQSSRLGAVTAVADLADRTDATLIPYDWYRDLVLEGALQHAIPKAYIRDYIQSVRVEDTRGSTYRDAKEAKALVERIRNARNAAQIIAASI
jgi:gamma-glutamylcyclotransferase